MSQNGIRYTEEFKKQLVDLYQAGSSVSYLSREYGVSNVTIYKWIKFEVSASFKYDSVARNVYVYNETGSYNKGAG